MLNSRPSSVSATERPASQSAYLRRLNRLDGLSAAEVAVGGVLIDYADIGNGTGVCWPKEATVADESGLSERHGKRTVKALEGKRVVKVYRLRDAWGHNANAYALFPDRGDDLDEAVWQILRQKAKKRFGKLSRSRFDKMLAVSPGEPDDHGTSGQTQGTSETIPGDIQNPRDIKTQGTSTPNRRQYPGDGMSPGNKDRDRNVKVKTKREKFQKRTRSHGTSASQGTSAAMTRSLTGHQPGGQTRSARFRRSESSEQVPSLLIKRNINARGHQVTWVRVPGNVSGIALEATRRHRRCRMTRSGCFARLPSSSPRGTSSMRRP